MTDARQQFRTLYRRARREKLPYGSRELAQAVCDITGGTFGNGWRFPELQLQRAADIALRPADDMRRTLARNVLNGFGHGNPFRAPDPGPGSYYRPTPRYEAWRRFALRAAGLRRRLQAAGRLELDAGNWATGVFHPAALPSNTADAGDAMVPAC